MLLSFFDHARKRRLYTEDEDDIKTHTVASVRHENIRSASARRVISARFFIALIGMRAAMRFAAAARRHLLIHAVTAYSCFIRG